MKLNTKTGKKPQQQPQKKKTLNQEKAQNSLTYQTEATPCLTLSTVWKQQLFAIAKFIGAASRTVQRVGLYKGPG